MIRKEKHNEILMAIGALLTEKRKALGIQYASREKFIEKRNQELFVQEQPWISAKHLTNIELGKNWISLEKLILHADALEISPVELFSEILDIYHKYSDK